MSNILITGDSWGTGEFDHRTMALTHTGLQHYLEKDGHTVVNLSKRGSSNYDALTRLELWLKKYGQISIDAVFVWQTEYTRDLAQYQYIQPLETWNAVSIDDLSSMWITRFYASLSQLSQEYKFKVKIIGGCSDTQWFDDMETEYPGCEIVCQSLTTLLLANNHKIEVPVFSWYDRTTEPILQFFKNNETTDRILDLIDQGFKRESLLHENPELFYPDGKHPNRVAYAKLYDFLQQTSVV